MRLRINAVRPARSEEAYRRQQRFINDVSHELRTPLTIIRGYIDILERYGADDRELFTEAVSSIKDSAQNMQCLIENLLFLARAEQGHQTLTPVPVDLDNLLIKFVADYRSPRVKITKLEPCRMMGDAYFLKKMFTAFLDNAISFSPPESLVKIELTVTDEVTLKFIDKGCGIAEEELDKIFELFYRSDTSRTKRGDSSSAGLGLSIAKWIADRHGIKITVKSTPSAGSIFALTIPKI